MEWPRKPRLCCIHSRYKTKQFNEVKRKKNKKGQRGWKCAPRVVLDLSLTGTTQRRVDRLSVEAV
jgi:hypothetical protein